MKNKIYFYQVNFEIGFGKFKTHWLPYAVAKLWSNCKIHEEINSKWYVEDYIFERLPIDQIEKYLSSPTLVAFSSYIWNWNYNLQAAKRIKEIWPDTIIVFGGPQVPENKTRLELLYDEHPYIDYTFHGESENSFKDFLIYISNNKSGTLPSGITHHGNYSNTVGSRVENLHDLKSPFLDGVFDDILKKHPEKKFSVTLETNRGCPYACTFCDWGSLTFNKVKQFDSDMVKKEIEWISKNSIRFVDVSDANFGIMKDRDFDILRHMIEQKQKYGFPETYSFNWQKNSSDKTLEMVEYLTSNNSSRGFTLSAQSMSDEVLTNIKRRNLEINNFRSILKKCNLNNIQTYTELILGLPGETKKSWSEGTIKLLESGQHNNIEVWFCQMLENAELNSPSSLGEYDIVSTPIYNYISGQFSEDIYEGINVIKSTKTMTFNDLIDSYMFSWMITNFHSFGWTQIISRWLNETGEMAYSNFYDKFYQFIREDEFISKFYNQVKLEIINTFNTGLVSGSGLHYYIAEYQKIFHKNRNEVINSVKRFILKNDIKIDSEVIRFSDEFITYYGSDKIKNVKFTIPVWEVLNSVDTQVKPEYNYDFYMTEYPSDENEYYDSFYFRRRKGWGKYNVVIK